MGEATASIQFLVPNVGDPALLRETIGNAVAQSDPDWALCVVEDGPQGTGVADCPELVVVPDVVVGHRRHARSVSSLAAASRDRFAEEARLNVELRGAVLA